MAASASAQIHSQAQRFASVAWASEEMSTGPLGAVGGGRNGAHQRGAAPEETPGFRTSQA